MPRGQRCVRRRRRAHAPPARSRGSRRPPARRAPRRAPGSRRARRMAHDRGRRRAARAPESSSTSVSRMNSTRRSRRRGSASRISRSKTNAQNDRRAAQRARQRGVVEVAQVAAEPDEGAVGRTGDAEDIRLRRTAATTASGRGFAGGAVGRKGGRPATAVAAGRAPIVGPEVPVACLQLERMGATVNLTHHFLIAMPAMADPHFAHTLTYVCEHNDDGALGIVVNKPIDMTLSALFEQIEHPARRRPSCATRRCISAARCRSTAASCCTGRSATGNRRSRSATTSASRRRGTSSRPSAAATARSDVLVSLGYAGWSAGQLEQELAQNAWLTVAADADVLFDAAARGAPAGGDAAARHRFLAPVRGRRACLTRGRDDRRPTA